MANVIKIICVNAKIAKKLISATKAKKNIAKDGNPSRNSKAYKQEITARLKRDVSLSTGKNITTGKLKAINKVQKGLDKTENRVRNFNVKSSLSDDGKIKITDKGFSGTVRGSNKAAAKGNVPKRTPGVRKNKSFQRSINNSNNNLKK